MGKMFRNKKNAVLFCRVFKAQQQTFSRDDDMLS